MATFERELIKKIRVEKTETLKILEETKKLKQEENNRVRQARELEAYKFEQFKKIIDGKDYFRIDHINQLNLPNEICIHLSAKNAGKTTEIYRMISQILDKGEKFLYGRVQKSELDTEAEEFNQREESPIFAIKYNNNWYYYRKSEVLAYLDSTREINQNGEIICTLPTLPKLRNAGLQYVGKGYSFLASNCLSGGKYEGYNTIFFDEILSYSPVNRISKKVLDAWDCSVSTIQRSKENIKLYLFGNLHDVPSHPILNHYGIDISDQFRYITRGEGNQLCRILFVNSGGLYRKTIGHKGGAANHMSAERRVFLKHNRVIKPTGNILTPHIFENMEHVLSFAVNIGGLNNDVVYVELRTTGKQGEEEKEEEENTFYCITCGQLKITTLTKGEIYTENPTIYNSFQNTTKKYTIQAIFNNVYRLFKYSLLYFDCYESMELYKSVINFNSNLIYENQTNINNLWALK